MVKSNCQISWSSTSLPFPEDETLEQQASGAGQIVDFMVDPAIEICLATSEEKQRAEAEVGLSRVRVELFDVCKGRENLFERNGDLTSLIEPYGFTKEKQEVVDRLIDEKVEGFVNDHVRSLLQRALRN